MPLLAARGLVKSFPHSHGRVDALRGCDLELAVGEVVAVVGPSGAGKSTLLNILSGLDAPDAGELLFRDESLGRFTARQWSDWRRVHAGFVFQFHFLLPDFTALENLLLPVRLAGGDLDQAQQFAGGLLQRLGLADRVDHLPGELSGGEQQRVAVARAFMNRPSIVFADEPFGNLDRSRSRELTDLMLALGRENDCGMLIVTHDTELAGRCDRVLELHGGRLQHR